MYNSGYDVRVGGNGDNKEVVMYQMYQCPNCSSPIANGAELCSRCGLVFQRQQQGQSAPVYQQQATGNYGYGQQIKKHVSIKYTGNGADIFGRFLLWMLLCLITVGIYGPWAINNFWRYIIEHIEVDVPA